MRRKKIRNVWNLKGNIAYSRKNENKKMMFSEDEKKSVVKMRKIEEIKKENQEDRMKEVVREIKLVKVSERGKSS